PHRLEPSLTTVWTSSTSRGTPVDSVWAGNVPSAPAAVQEMSHVTLTVAGQASGRSSVPVRYRYTYAHAPGAAAWTSGSGPLGSNRVPGGSHSIGDDPGSPGSNVNVGSAARLTHTPPMQRSRVNPST